jgi:hypothetical protein
MMVRTKRDKESTCTYHSCCSSQCQLRMSYTSYTLRSALSLSIILTADTEQQQTAQFTHDIDYKMCMYSMHIQGESKTDLVRNMTISARGTIRCVNRSCSKTTAFVPGVSTCSSDNRSAYNRQHHRISTSASNDVKHTFYQVSMHALKLELKTQNSHQAQCLFVMHCR